MPGDEWQRFANLRAYYGLMWGYPGKKLLFMGQEFGQRSEWNFAGAARLAPAATTRRTAACRLLVRDLNRLYRDLPALHARDCEAEGFRWIVADDAAQSVFAWLRLGAGRSRRWWCSCNFTPVPRADYRIGLPHAGALAGDAEHRRRRLWRLGPRQSRARSTAEPVGAHGLPASAELLLPPLARVVAGAGR